MSITLYDRVLETTTITGTGTITLAGAVAGYQSFQNTVGAGNPTYYAIADPIANTWEVGIGTLTTSTTLSRTVLTSSNSNQLVTLAGNTSNVFLDAPASRRFDTDMVASISQGGTGLASNHAVYGLQTQWLSTTNLQVNPGTATDSTGTTSMNLAASATATLAAASFGALGGFDSVTMTGTVATSTLTAGLVTGTNTSFTTAWGQRTAAGTIASSGSTLTGTGTKFLSQVAAFDLIGSSAIVSGSTIYGYWHVSSIQSDTSLQITTPANAFTGQTPVVIENPIITCGAQTSQGISKIVSDTSLTLVSNNSAQATGLTGYAGRFAHYSSLNGFYYVFLAVSGGNTGLLLSCQRTTPIMPLTSFRRIASIVLDQNGNILPFGQRGTLNDRQYELFIDVNTNQSRLVNASATANTWTTISASGIVPPTANSLAMSVYGVGAGFLSVRPANNSLAGTAALARYNVPAAASGIGFNAQIYLCDGGQNIQWFQATGNSGATIDVWGWAEAI